jgi:hypothetical protein
MSQKIENFFQLGELIKARYEFCEGNEEQTKISLIQPFFRFLGFDYEDPLQVIAETYTSRAIDTKNSMDYVLKKNGQKICIEAKPYGKELTQDQLNRYLSLCTDIKIGIITDGVEYHFYQHIPTETSLKHLYELNLSKLDINNNYDEVLKNLFYSDFEETKLLERLESEGEIKAIKNYINKLIKDPDKNFVYQIWRSTNPQNKKFTDTIYQVFKVKVKTSLEYALQEMASDFQAKKDDLLNNKNQETVIIDINHQNSNNDDSENDFTNDNLQVTEFKKSLNSLKSQRHVKKIYGQRITLSNNKVFNFTCDSGKIKVFNKECESIFNNINDAIEFLKLKSNAS